MSDADLVPGNRFRLYRESDLSPGSFYYVGLATTVGFTRSSDYEDATAPSLSDVLATPNRRSSRKSRAWDLSFSGRVDAASFGDIEHDEAADDPHAYQIKVDKSADAGGKTYTGPIFFETLEIGTQERGFVTFSAKCRGDGAFVTAGAAPEMPADALLLAGTLITLNAQPITKAS